MLLLIAIRRLGKGKKDSQTKVAWLYPRTGPPTNIQVRSRRIPAFTESLARLKSGAIFGKSTHLQPRLEWLTTMNYIQLMRYSHAPKAFRSRAQMRGTARVICSTIDHFKKFERSCDDRRICNPLRAKLGSVPEPHTRRSAAPTASMLNYRHDMNAACHCCRHRGACGEVSIGQRAG